MIFGICRSYFISWQIFENKVWCPVSKKRWRHSHFLLSLAYPIDRLDLALFSVVILFHHWLPLLEKVEIQAFIFPRNFPAVLIIFTGRGGEPTHPHSAGRGAPPSLWGRFPAGRGVHPWYFESNMPCWTRTRTYFPALTVNWLSSSHLLPLEALHCPGHDLHCSLKSEWFRLRSFPEADAPVIMGVSVKNYVAHFVRRGARSTVQPLSLISFYCAASFIRVILALVN